MGLAMRSLEHENNLEFLRDFTFPEEDRHLFTTAVWSGGFRWFRSSNVIPLERYCRFAQERYLNER
jgi:hypothetical protein